MKIFMLFSITITSSVLCVQNGVKRKLMTKDRVLSDSGTSLCDPYEPSVPNFSSPGRRISKEKCMEYIWQGNLRHEQEKRQRKCVHNYLRHKFPSHNRVVDGLSMPPGEFPHMGALGWKASGGGTWVFKCGSALISPKFLLTAAHCSRTSSADWSVADPVPKIVRLGDKNIADVYSNHHLPRDEIIARIILHPKYSYPKKYNNIAIIKLTREVVFTKFVQPACLWTKSNISSLTKITVTGWGVVESSNLRHSPKLKVTKVDLIDSKVCSPLLLRYCNKMWCGLQNQQICAGKLDGVWAPCQGDFGGTLQVKIRLNITDQGSMHYLVGVTSFGIGCALPKTPGIYTRVSSYISWIEKIVWPDERGAA